MVILKQDIKNINDYIAWKMQYSFYGKNRNYHKETEHKYYTKDELKIINDTVFIYNYSDKGFIIIGVKDGDSEILFSNPELNKR